MIAQVSSRLVNQIDAIEGRLGPGRQKHCMSKIKPCSSQND